MTIQNVAKKAGVSTATVSRMINETTFVNAETKERILTAMKAVGYDPARRKRRKAPVFQSPLKHQNTAMIWVGGDDAQLTHTGQNMMQGITEALREMGASLTVDHLDSSGYIPRALMAGKLDGIFINGPAPSPAICDQLKKFPTVWLLQTGSVDFGDRVQPDHTFAGELAYGYLVNKGCRNLCCMSYAATPGHFQYWKSRTDSFVSHAAQNGIPCSLLDLPEPDNPESRQSDLAAAAANLVNSLIRLHKKPDGLFVANNLGVYVHNELSRHSVIPMKDLFMVAGDTMVCTQHMSPDPVKIRIFSKQIGQMAVEALLLRIRKPNMPNITHLIKPELVIP
ncbi:MAG: LacI family DNA-binding transcriptional regulator [Kiritimatiellales bacterium]